ncbi:MAG: hypothetical protein K0S74_1594 [Chlamydiales bacterium]|jgi:hypothetical protein|nr:hypothetical protein [Chlamydiales bacterium]
MSTHSIVSYAQWKNIPDSIKEIILVKLPSKRLLILRLVDKSFKVHIENLFLTGKVSLNEKDFRLIRFVKGKFIKEISADAAICYIDKLLHIFCVDPAAKNSLAFVAAAAAGYLNVIEYLIKCPKVDIATYNNLALRSAVEKGHFEIVNLLLKQPEVDPTVNNNEAFRSAVEKGHFEIVNLLLKQPKVDPTADNNEALRSAVNRKYSLIVEALMQNEFVRALLRNDENLQNKIDTFRNEENTLPFANTLNRPVCTIT